jgi:Ni,Fe-hydrogenase I cytochrome b subunit
MTTHRARIHTGFERFRHWTQALLIIILMVTGFEIHGSYSRLGYEAATSSSSR